MSDSALFEVVNRIGVITLNRPQVLNALSHDMVRLIADQLEAWRHDDTVAAVLMTAAGEKAFCAGGDIRSMYDSHKDGTRTYAGFFADEYLLDYALWRYSKPIVALMHGITMGGGMGLAQAASLRIATDKTRMAMPETGIGLIPDVGGSFFLSRMQPELALYLGLSGQTIYAADARYCGLADVYIEGDAVQQVLPRLQQIDWESGAAPALERIRSAIDSLTSQPAEPPLAKAASALIEHFSKPGVKAIMDSLRTASGPHAEWAAATLALLEQRSPLSMGIVFRLLEEGRRLDLADCFRQEYNLVIHCIEDGDFIEGVRALIVDKDKNPKWNPATIAEVSDDRVASFFGGKLGDSGHPLAGLGR